MHFRLILFFCCINYLSCFRVNPEQKAEAKIVYCPAGFKAVNDQCFRLIGNYPRDEGRKLCSRYNAILPEILTWDQQNNLEKFMKDQKIAMPVWLNGDITFTKHREALLKFFWPSTFFPKINNFKEKLTTLFGASDCVYVSSKLNFYWQQTICNNLLSVVCVKRTRMIGGLLSKH